MSSATDDLPKGPALTAPSVRLFAILARSARRAVVFRRGPSKQVLLLSWNTETDEVTPGQWFKGRLYERRADLSPSGDKLVYFAAKYRAPLDTWTAVSRPPWLTALALWPRGGAWGGGGLFDTESRLRLNHWGSAMELAQGFQLPSRFQVELLWERSGTGEDFPIYDFRLRRDGWRCTQPGTAELRSTVPSMYFTYDPALTYRKPRPGRGAGGLELQMRILGLKEINGPWYVVEYDLLDEASEDLLSLGRLDWAEWDVTGELLFARDGRLYRVEPRRHRGAWEVGEPREVADLRGYVFQGREAPPKATRW
ncbi:MAG TPA: hypothetical protein VF815_27065 [Myxococcaceae bacterium]|jgi:hypothetical protein